jgi:hypothetical protein
VILAHAFGIGGVHAEHLPVGVAVGIVGLWMLRTGTDARGGRVLIGIGVLLAIASLVA